MSIRSYKDIYSKFASMFPELNSIIGSWKGIKFRDRHIIIEMKDGSVIHFQYFNSKSWYLYSNPGQGEENAA